MINLNNYILESCKEIKNPKLTRLLKNHGLEKVILCKADGYFYITSNDDETALEIAGLRDNAIYVNSFNQQTPEQWVEDILLLLKDSELLKESILDTDELINSNINIFEIIGKSKNTHEFINNVENCLKICEDYKPNKKYNDNDYIIRYELSGVKRDIPYLCFGKVSEKLMYTMRDSNGYLIMDKYRKSIYDIDLTSPLSIHKVYSPKKDISKEIEKLHKSSK